MITTTSHTVGYLANAWRQAGISEGDVLLIHSSSTRLIRRLKREGRDASPEAIAKSFLAAVGPEGTVLFPTFNFGFASGEAFDIRSTPSQMGAITNVALHIPGAIRTGHPIYSFAVVGARAAELAPVCNSSGYGTDSPFGYLHHWHGCIAVLDLPDQNSMTFYHYVEECHQVNYRYHKIFTGQYIDQTGYASVRQFGVFVRDLERGVKTLVNPMSEILWREGLYAGERPGEGFGLRSISASTAFDRLAQVIREGKARGLLYTDADTP